jgi:hypothetical protein
VNDKLEMFWKKAVVAYFKMLSQDLPGEAEKKPRKHQSGLPVSESRFGPGISRIRSRIIGKLVVRLRTL